MGLWAYVIHPLVMLSKYFEAFLVYLSAGQYPDVA